MSSERQQYNLAKKVDSTAPIYAPVERNLVTLKQNQTSSTKKNIHSENQCPQVLPDFTQKFLIQTKKKLHSSTQNLKEFHKKRLTYKSSKQNYDFSIISGQIKATKQKLKIKNFSKPGQNKAKITNLHNITLKLKLNLIQKILSPIQFQQFEKEISKKIGFLSKKYAQKPDLEDKILDYYTSYEVLSRFLQQMAKDSKKLLLKQQNIGLYYRMKDQMTGLLSNEQYFQRHLNQLEKSQSERQKELIFKTLHQQQRFTKTASKGKYFAGKQLQKNLEQRIEQLFEISKNNIKQAFCNFGKPHLMQQIQLQFSKRFNRLNTALFAQ